MRQLPLGQLLLCIAIGSKGPGRKSYLHQYARLYAWRKKTKRRSTYNETIILMNDILPNPDRPVREWFPTVPPPLFPRKRGKRYNAYQIIRRVSP